MAASLLATLGVCALRVGEKHVESPATQKARAILAYLAMHRGVDVSRERLLELFWPDTDPERGRDNLRTALWSIRRCLRGAGVDADEFLTANKSVVRWSAETVVDAQDFERLVRGSEADLTAALALYKGDFLEGDYDDWAVAERERLASIFEAALGRSLRLSPDAQTAQLLLSRNPYDEDAYATLIDAELAAGRRMAALAYVDRCRTAMREIGAAPSDSFERRFAALGRPIETSAPELKLPFVGRETELASMARALDDALAGSGSLTLVYGEPGIGKSALLAAATRVASSRGMRALVVRCVESEARMFGPWPQLFETLTDGDFKALAQSAGAGAADAFAVAMADELDDPSLVIVDDAHALNGVSLDILEALVPLLAARHAVIISTRPEGLARLRARTASLRYDEAQLRPLERGALRSAFGELTGDGSAPILDALYERTGGHPLFVSAMLESLASSGAATRDGHRWRFEPNATGQLKLPSSLRRHIEVRLRSCGEDACAAACAVALEPMATTDQLIEALDMPDERVLDAVDELLAHGLVVEPPTGPLFAFAHDIVAEVAATLLNAGRRSRLHQKFATQLQSMQARDRWLRLARHLRAAGKPLEAGAAYHDASMEAVEWSAFGDVVMRADEGIAAVEVLDRSPARDAQLALLERAKSGGLVFGGDAPGAMAPAEKAVTYARASGDQDVLVRALLARAFAGSESGDVGRQLEDSAEAIAIARRLGDGVKLAKALVQHATAATLLAQTGGVADELREAHEIAVNAGEWGLVESALAETVYANTVAQRFADALDAADRCLAAGRQSEPSALATAYHNRAAVWYAIDRFDDALRDLDEADAIVAQSRGVQERWGRGGITGPTIVFALGYLRALVATRLGRFSDAIASLEAIRVGASGVLRSRRYGCAFRMAAIDVLLRRDEDGDAAAAALEAAGLPDDMEPRGIVGWGDAPALSRARVAARDGSIDAALLETALSALERFADKTPLDVDRWFDALAVIAHDAGAIELAGRARRRAERHLSARRDAAGPLWGGASASPGTAVDNQLTVRP